MPGARIWTHGPDPPDQEHSDHEGNATPGIINIRQHTNHLENFFSKKYGSPEVNLKIPLSFVMQHKSGIYFTYFIFWHETICITTVR